MRAGWKKGWRLGVILALLVVLTACQTEQTQKVTQQQAAKTLAKLPEQVTNSKKSIAGGHFKYALVSWSPFKGIFNEALATDTNDQIIAAPGNEGLFRYNADFRIVDGGAANLRLDVAAKTATITINDRVRWSDGQPLIAADILYSYQIIANPQSQSQRYTGSLAGIVGLAEYHAGKTNQISGITMPDGAQGKRVVIQFKAMKPGMTHSGNGYFWEYASPSHQLAQIPFAKLATSSALREQPLFFGAFKVKSIEAGQSVTWVPNPYYYGSKPHLAAITFNVVSPNAVVGAMRKHRYDVATVASDQWADLQHVARTDFLARQPLSYRYLAFKVGTYQNGHNVMDPQSKMADLALRQALIYGLDLDKITKKYTNGWQFRIKTLIPAAFKQYYNPQAQSYSYDPAKAAKLLDQAGYRKKGKWRTQPNGQPLVLHFAAKQDLTGKDEIVQAYLAAWHRLGLNVKLTSGRLLEANSFYDKLENDDPEIDFFEAGWDLSTEPSPADLYSATAPFNFGRFVTAENTALLNKIDGLGAFNEQERIKAFKSWQTYMNQAAYVVPTTGSYDVRAINARVKGFSLAPDANWKDVSVTAKSR
ncbi:oligopeptide ABC transporter substrate-binding protein [Lapidilactobacillus achengensis]|uniref:Oligopeptide ABC transporter substrate-binding protein n=1 Tax=Lapidilactobacillus achengensis TaxID=2486000 RepID=A0ABW1UPS9_9LACO|nr:oligopeptide ABC transporter substrate-binding protein [Lapidilactobacillus achengensis]